MLTCVDHVVVAVADLKAAQASYVSLLGRTPSWAGEHPEYGTRNVLFRLRNTYVELLSPAGEGAVADGLRAWLDEHGEGLYAIALGTDSAEAEAKALRERGLSASEPVLALGQDGRSGAFRRFKNVFLPPEETGGVRLFVIEHLSLPDELPPSLPLSEEGSVADAVDHVVIMTRDPDRAVELFRDKLGIRLALDKRFEERGVRLLFFRLGGVTLEVGARLSQTADLESPPAEDDHLWGIAYQVADADAARERLDLTSVAVSPVRAGHKPRTRVFSAKAGVNGVATLLIEPAPRSEVE